MKTLADTHPSVLQPEVRLDDLAAVVVTTVVLADDDDAVDDAFADAYLPPNRRNCSPSGCSAAKRAFLRSSCTVSTYVATMTIMGM